MSKKKCRVVSSSEGEERRESADYCVCAISRMQGERKRQERERENVREGTLGVDLSLGLPTKSAVYVQLLERWKAK